MNHTFSIDAEQLQSTTTSFPTISNTTSLDIDDCAPVIRRRCMVCDVYIPYDKAYPLCDECRYRIYDMIYGSRNAFDGYAFFDGHIWEEEDK